MGEVGEGVPGPGSRQEGWGRSCYYTFETSHQYITYQFLSFSGFLHIADDLHPHRPSSDPSWRHVPSQGRHSPLLVACTLPRPAHTSPGGLHPPRAGTAPSWQPVPSQGQHSSLLAACTLPGPAQIPPGGLYPPRASTHPYWGPYPPRAGTAPSWWPVPSHGRDRPILLACTLCKAN